MSVRDAQRAALWRAAFRLERQSLRAKRAPLARAVFLFTDPERTPDPAKTASRLPSGAGVVFRGFGRADAAAKASELARVSKRRRLVLLVGSDERLARKLGARGVHLPERELWRARRLRQRHPLWIITGAAHSALALQTADACQLDAVFVSAVFPSQSPSAKRPIGALRLAGMIRGIRTPVYALGGVNGATVRRLWPTGAAGFAAIEALAA